jgi:hypothetical protein
LIELRIERTCGVMRVGVVVSAACDTGGHGNTLTHET